MRLIKITFDTVTPESAADGEAAESGWIDEQGYEIVPDEYDLEESNGDESAAAVALACAKITADGWVEPSSSQWHPGVWYMQIDGDTDYRDGSETRLSFHLEGFSEEEQRAIFAFVNNSK